jgi:hypothetical protein
MGGGCQNIVLLKKKKKRHEGNELKSKKGQNEIENSIEAGVRRGTWYLFKYQSRAGLAKHPVHRAFAQNNKSTFPTCTSLLRSFSSLY